MTSAGRDLRLLDRLWSLRYARPEALEGLASVDECPQKQVLLANLAWREQELDEALTLLQPALAPGVMDARWASRALNIQGVVLLELGLVEDAIETQWRAAERAEEAGDLIMQAAVANDLGVACMEGHPDRAAEHLRRAIVLARQVRSGPAEEARESCALEALAIVNLYDLAESHAPGVAPEVPGLAAAERLAMRAWPDLAAHVRATRVLRCLEGVTRERLGSSRAPCRPPRTCTTWPTPSRWRGC